MNTPHPELELLAELAEMAPAEPGGAPADPERAEALAHVASCDKCAADIAALRGVRTALRSLPPVPMPDDVANRIEGALRAAAPAHGVVPEQAGEPAQPAPNVSVLPRRAGGHARAPHFSAAAAVLVVVVVALGAGIAALAAHGGGPHGSSASGKSAENTAGGGFSTKTLRLVASGNDYNPESIRPKVAALVMAQVPGAAASYHALAPLAAQAPGADVAARPSAAATPTVNSTAAGTGAGTAAAPAASSPPSEQFGTSALVNAGAKAVRSPAGPLAAPAALEACVVKLVGKAERPVLVDYALFQDKPATIIVLADPDNAAMLDVYVYADTMNCAAGDVFAYWASLPTGA